MQGPSSGRSAWVGLGLGGVSGKVTDVTTFTYLAGQHNAVHCDLSALDTVVEIRRAREMTEQTVKALELQLAAEKIKCRMLLNVEACMLHQQQTSHLGHIEHGLQQQVPGDDDVAARTRGRASSDAAGSEGGPLQASEES